MAPKKKPDRILRTPKTRKKITQTIVEDSDVDSQGESSEELLEDSEIGDAEIIEDHSFYEVENESSNDSKLEDQQALLPVLDQKNKALSPTDPLKQYLTEVSRYHLLTPEEELKLALTLQKTGDLNAAKRLVTANLRLVVKIAFEYKSMYSNLMDLIQEGNIGLMKAVSKYDPSKGARLGYYASWWIRSYILKYLLDNFRLVKIGTTQAQKKLFYHLVREKEKLEAQGFTAAPKLLAEKLDVREKDILEMQQRLSSHGNEVSLDTPISTESSGKSIYLDFVPDESTELQDQKMIQVELLDVLKEKLPDFKHTLNEKELRVLEERMLSEEPKTLQEVADNYGLTRERARQIEKKVTEKLQEFLKPYFGNLL